MNEIFEPLATVVPQKYAGQLALLLVVSQVLGRAFHALRAGGGLKSLFTSVWLGTNTPRANQPGEPQDKKQQRLFVGLLCVGLCLAATGCVNPSPALLRELAKSPSTVSTKVVTPWGHAQLTRVGGQTNNTVTVSPDGTITIRPGAN